MTARECELGSLCRFGGAKMWLKKDLPDGRQVQRIFIPKGFDWVKTISPMLSKAGEGPVMWCPVTHFGYLESGSMGIKFKDDPDNIKIIKVGRPCGNQIMSRRFSPMPEA